MKRLFSKFLVTFFCVVGMLGQSALLMSLPFLSTEAVAQTSTASAEPASREDVQNLFAVLNLDRMMKVTMQAAAEQVKTNLPEIMKQQNIEIPKDQLDAMTEDMFHDYPMKEVLDSMVPVYQKHLNKMDVANILAFYKSPTGQQITLRVIDILTLTGDRIRAIHMVADELGALAAVGVVRLPLGG